MLNNKNLAPKIEYHIIHIAVEWRFVDFKLFAADYKEVINAGMQSDIFLCFGSSGLVVVVYIAV